MWMPLKKRSLRALKGIFANVNVSARGLPPASGCSSILHIQPLVSSTKRAAVSVGTGITIEAQ